MKTNSIQPRETSTYYVVRAAHNMLELRQTRFAKLDSEHPHDVCAVARNEQELREMVEKYLTGSVDWNTLTP